ncbi:uncharacterized protein A4U43_C04F21980 [Asparagus officinalis]|uniref:Uncharacterized protein n=1 Tax=Asparagus officinalis TaxID=4686 RepID=A0A5P1F7Q0_ASPOF|nr:uncharacterized protein A4U43_C04F21980 [Asparagus officinalis]
MMKRDLGSVLVAEAADVELAVSGVLVGAKTMTSFLILAVGGDDGAKTIKERRRRWIKAVGVDDGQLALSALFETFEIVAWDTVVCEIS